MTASTLPILPTTVAGSYAIPDVISDGEMRRQGFVVSPGPSSDT